MNKQSAFDNQHIKGALFSERNGLMDQLNLPPGFIAFVRKNKKQLWTITIVISVIVVSVSLYGSYAEYRLQKAASALTLALKADGSHKEQLLKEVYEKYASTSPGLWSKIELAHMKFHQGKTDETIAILQEVNEKVPEGGLLKPLLLNNLAVLYENSGMLDKALTMYGLLAENAGFKADADEATGRIYEKQGKKDLAIEKYQLYLALTGQEKSQYPKNSQVRDRVEAALNRLQK